MLLGFTWCLVEMGRGLRSRYLCEGDAVCIAKLLLAHCNDADPDIYMHTHLALLECSVSFPAVRCLVGEAMVNLMASESGPNSDKFRKYFACDLIRQSYRALGRMQLERLIKIVFSLFFNETDVELQVHLASLLGILLACTNRPRITFRQEVDRLSAMMSHESKKLCRLAQDLNFLCC